MVIIGCQWGDEGKGKIVDTLAQNADLVVRFQGGANAGHTLVFQGKKTVLHLIPSGVLNPSCMCVITPGVALDLEILSEEIELLKKEKLLKNNLLISSNTTLLLNFHKLIDKAREKKFKIGTTHRGIGPAYEDRISRRAILFGDIFYPDTLKDKLIYALEEKNQLLKFYNEEIINVDKLHEELLRYAEKLKNFRCDDTSKLISDYHKDGKKIIFEGAQGAMLDVLHGTYPFVTSSSTIAGSALSSAGVGPDITGKVLGVMKVYCTRVGTGPFPSELTCEIGDRICEAGHEFGTTTNRKRRCGWLDLVALKYAIKLNGVNSLAVTKLDVLSDFETISVVTHYEIDGMKVSDFPCSFDKLSKAKPVLKTFPCWKKADFEKSKLPKNTESYISFIQEETGIPVEMAGIGPGREEIVNFSF